jgi:serine/threonine protein kinase
VASWLRELTARLNRIGFSDYFRPIQRIGKGGYALVYEVESLLDGRRYAVKALSKATLQREHRMMQGLISEVRIMRKLKHKNVLKLFGVFESTNSIYFLMELLRGGNLL